MGDGYECWNDDWDNDGDGEPDWTNFYEECDELSDGSGSGGATRSSMPATTR